MASIGEQFRRFVASVEAGFALPKVRQARLLRPRYPRMIAGVCSGLAEYFGWDMSLLRVLVVVLAAASLGLVVVGYAAAWVLIPEGQYALEASARTSGS